MGKYGNSFRFKSNLWNYFFCDHSRGTIHEKHKQNFTTMHRRSWKLLIESVAADRESAEHKTNFSLIEPT